ncbi:hypothetical protein [Scytonema sp. PCC 10023]|uniref:hypothetical protein n=1 Tax=Scytonema sp. PCC 10023 TaxID=1680591 RepID=UPI0039C61727
MNIYHKLAVTTVGVAISSAVIAPYPAYANTQVTPLFYHSNLPTTEIYNYVQKLNATYIDNDTIAIKGLQGLRLLNLLVDNPDIFSSKRAFTRAIVTSRVLIFHVNENEVFLLPVANHGLVSLTALMVALAVVLVVIAVLLVTTLPLIASNVAGASQVHK